MTPCSTGFKHERRGHRQCVFDRVSGRTRPCRTKVRIGIVGTSWWVDMMYRPSLNCQRRTKMCESPTSKARTGWRGGAAGWSSHQGQFKKLIRNGSISPIHFQLQCHVPRCFLHQSSHILRRCWKGSSISPIWKQSSQPRSLLLMAMLNGARSRARVYGSREAR